MRELRRKACQRKVKERTVAQAIQAILQWRSNAQRGVKSLEIAAVVVDVPRKTLEDYTNIIRTAIRSKELDLSNYETLKMGSLRKDVKLIISREKQARLAEGVKK